MNPTTAALFTTGYHHFERAPEAPKPAPACRGCRDKGEMVRDVWNPTTHRHVETTLTCGCAAGLAKRLTASLEGAAEAVLRAELVPVQVEAPAIPTGQRDFGRWLKTAGHEDLEAGLRQPELPAYHRGQVEQKLALIRSGGGYGIATTATAAGDDCPF